MKLLQFSLLTILISSVFSLNRLLLSNSSFCRIIQKIVIKTKQSFFVNEHSVTFVELSSEKIDVDCGLDAFKPVEVYSDEKKVKFAVQMTVQFVGIQRPTVIC
jgi:hypothetical protein